MPELPEVETTARGVAARLLGRTIIKVEKRRADLREKMPLRLAGLLTGQRLIEVTRRAKYMLLRLSGKQTLLIHLGMSGRLVISNSDDGLRDKHDHVVLHFDDGAVLKFNDARRFGLIDVMPTAQESEHPRLAALGPEPFEDGFNKAAFAGRKTPIKLALLDQKVVVGIGNIYACEALHKAHLSPLRPASSLNEGEVKRLVEAVRKVLTAAITAGGSSLRDYLQTSGELGYFQHHFAVYDREGQPCRQKGCKSLIMRQIQGGRSTFWCEACQR